jgi:hypothetical protein
MKLAVARYNKSVYHYKKNLQSDKDLNPLSDRQAVKKVIVVYLL